MKSLEDRFWFKVQKTDNCWIWIAGKNRDGYGQINIKGETKRTHKISWIWANGEIPNNLQVLHKCDNPSCVNPDHLFLGTQRDNIKDMVKKNRQSNKMGRKGEKHSQNKLTEIDIIDIRNSYKNGEYNQYELAKKYSVGQAQISRIIK